MILLFSQKLYLLFGVSLLCIYALIKAKKGKGIKRHLAIVSLVTTLLVSLYSIFVVVCWKVDADEFMVKTAAAEAPELIKWRLDRGADVNTRDKSGRTVLMIASQHGYSDVVRLLLERGADVNATDKSGATALSLANSHKHLNTANLLRANGASK